MSDRQSDASRTREPERPEAPAAPETPQPRHDQERELEREYAFFFQDGGPHGFGVASGKPGVSGRWVFGLTKREAIEHWFTAYNAGELTEEA